MFFIDGFSSSLVSTAIWESFINTNFLSLVLFLFINHAGLSVSERLPFESMFFVLLRLIYSYRNIGAHTMTLSCFLGGIVLAFFGPADFVMNLFGWDKPQEWLVIVCMSILGILMGGLIMPTFGEMILAAK